MVAGPLWPLSGSSANSAGAGAGNGQALAGAGGGSAGAAFKNKFVELYNPTDAAIPLDGTSVQYRSATGTTNFAPASLKSWA